MYIFLNDQVTKWRFWCTNSSKCPIWIWDPILEHYRRHMPKMANIMPN